MKIILGQKLNMDQLFAADGSVVPVTLLHVGPCTVTQVRNQEQDGYEAVQIGFGNKKHLAKPQRGHLKELGAFRWLREFRLENKKAPELKVGDVLDVTQFQIGDKLKVTGTSKGKGFQGVVRRHGFHGSPASHGHKDQLRMPGSNATKRQGPVSKGKRMGGHMGDERVSVANIEVVQIDPTANTIMVKGAVPGARNGLILLEA